jgi:outer membrane protein, heavy metal efflux system
MKKSNISILIIAGIILNTTIICAQDISVFIKQVSENNPEIIAYKKLLEARKLEARSGLTPDDPFVSFGYMPGNNPAMGTKKLWSVNQSFSFPTKYLTQKNISKSKIVLAEQEFNLGKLNIMLDAKQTLFDLIYNQQYLLVLEKRKKDYKKLKSAWEKMISLGEATIMDYNKILMEFSSLKLKINKTESNIRTLKNKLLFMNGNSTNLLKGLAYPLNKEPDPSDLISEKIISHPAFIIPEKEYLLNNEEIRLAKNGSLPEFQIAYSSEMIPGETYAGPVIGLSIPLWSNTNKVKAANAVADHSAAARDAELLRLKSDVLNEFDNMKSVKMSILELSTILKPDNNEKYLNIALENGEISLTTYFSGISVMYEIEDKLLELKNAYNKSLAILYDHDLLKLE